MQASNFAFLSERWPVLASLGQLAEEYVYTDPNSAMIKIRQIGETMTQLILATLNVPETEDRTLNSRPTNEARRYFHPRYTNLFSYHIKMSAIAPFMAYIAQHRLPRWPSPMRLRFQYVLWRRMAIGNSTRLYIGNKSRDTTMK